MLACSSRLYHRDERTRKLGWQTDSVIPSRVRKTTMCVKFLAFQLRPDQYQQYKVGDGTHCGMTSKYSGPKDDVHAQVLGYRYARDDVVLRILDEQDRDVDTRRQPGVLHVISTSSWALVTINTSLTC